MEVITNEFLNQKRKEMYRQIYELWQKGKSLNDIGRIYKMTPQRIGQICNRLNTNKYK